MAPPTTVNSSGYPAIRRFRSGGPVRMGQHVLLTIIGLIVQVVWFGCDKSADSIRPLRDTRTGSASSVVQDETVAANGVDDSITIRHSDDLLQLRKSRPAWFTDRDDPGEDGWDSEVFSQAASKQLKVLAKLLSHPEQVETAAVEKIVSNEFTCGLLRPKVLEVVFQDQSLTVSRSAQGTTPGEDVTPIVGQGAVALAEALRGLIGPLANADQVRVKLNCSVLHRNGVL